MQKAVAPVRNGMTYRAPAMKHDVSPSTLHLRVNGPPASPSRRIALTEKEEDRLVSFLVSFANRGVPLTQAHLREAVAIMVNGTDPTRRMLLPFRRGVPGSGYLRGFRRRHKEKLAFGKPVRQEAKRFAQVNAGVLTTHFATLKKLREENNLDAPRIFNLDESGVTPERDLHGVTASKRLMPRSGCRDICMPEFRNLHRVTIMPVISASGETAPPLFLFKGLRLPYRTLLGNGEVITETPLSKLPSGSLGAMREENGGIDTARFMDWGFSFVDHVEPLTQEGRKVLLIYDGYRAHLSLAILELFERNNIIVYVLPAHTSGKTQPLDVVLFSVFKNRLQNSISSCAAPGRGKEYDIFDMCSLIGDAYVHSFTVKNIQASFYRSGIWPLDAG